MKYYLITGEASGDLHCSLLIKALKKLDSKAQFRGWGGDLMAKEGTEANFIPSSNDKSGSKGKIPFI